MARRLVDEGEHNSCVAGREGVACQRRRGARRAGGGGGECTGQRRGARRAGGRGGECPARPSREEKGRGVRTAGRLDRRRGINGGRDVGFSPF
jgi:hypothetical protein